MLTINPKEVKVSEFHSYLLGAVAPRPIAFASTVDKDGNPNLAGRRAARFAEVLRTQVQIPIVFWDESFSTQDARASRIELGLPRKKRGGHLDDLAAVMILQSYLDQRQPGVAAPELVDRGS